MLQCRRYIHGSSEVQTVWREALVEGTVSAVRDPDEAAWGTKAHCPYCEPKPGKVVKVRKFGWIWGRFECYHCGREV